MKKQDKPHHITSNDLTQEQMEDLNEDLMVVIDAHIDAFGYEALFTQIFMYMTKALYESAPSHKVAHCILHTALNSGIMNHVSKHKGE